MSEKDEPINQRTTLHNSARARQGTHPTFHKTLPFKPDDWKSSTQLLHNYPGPHRVIKERLQALRKRLIKDIVAAGYPRDVAAELVEDHLIGVRAFHGGRPTLAASPDAIRVFDQVESIRLAGVSEQRNALAAKADTWRTSGELAKDYSCGPTVILERLKCLRDCLIDDVASAGYSKEDATRLIDDCLIGWRHPSGAPITVRALCASPGAVRIGETEGWLTLKQRGR